MTHNIPTLKQREKKHIFVRHGCPVKRCTGTQTKRPSVNSFWFVLYMKLKWQHLAAGQLCGGVAVGRLNPETRWRRTSHVSWMWKQEDRRAWTTCCVVLFGSVKCNEPPVWCDCDRSKEKKHKRFSILRCWTFVFHKDFKNHQLRLLYSFPLLQLEKTLMLHKLLKRIIYAFC